MLIFQLFIFNYLAKISKHLFSLFYSMALIIPNKICNYRVQLLKKFFGKIYRDHFLNIYNNSREKDHFYRIYFS